MHKNNGHHLLSACLLYMHIDVTPKIGKPLNINSHIDKFTVKFGFINITRVVSQLKVINWGQAMPQRVKCPPDPLKKHKDIHL